jgi:hypothetical protein
MNITEFHAAVVRIEGMVESKGLHGYTAGHVNWFGDQVSISVRAHESVDDKGYWKSEREFTGAIEDAATFVREAQQWVYALPNAEDRAIELMIQKLNKLAGELPKGSTDIAQAAWGEVHTMLMAKAESLAKNGLPSPARISQISA